MSFSVQGEAVVSPNSLHILSSQVLFSLRNFHIFHNEGKTFVFDPETVTVLEINRDEELYIRWIQGEERGKPTERNMRWQAEKIENVQRGLKKKLDLHVSPPEDVGTEDYPYEVEIMVNASQICNLSCDYCFVHRGRFNYTGARGQFVSKRHLEKLVFALPEAFPLTQRYDIHFYGGEPLLNLSAISHCVDTIHKMNDNRFSLTITTNGTVLTDEAIAVLGRGRFDVVLSIDGPPHIHDAVRRTHADEPSHAVVMEFLRRIKSEFNLMVRGSSVVRHGWSLKDATAYLKRLPVDLIKAQAVRIQDSHPLALTQKERQDYISHLLEIAEDVKQSLDAESYPMDDRFRGTVLQLLMKKKRTVFCGAGKSLFGMSAEGRMLVCALLAGAESSDLGSIEDPLHLWVEKGAQYRKLFRPKKACHECWALPLCGGGCFAMQSACGDVDCDFMRGTCEGALRIYASFYKERPHDLLILAGIMGDEIEF